MPATKSKIQSPADGLASINHACQFLDVSRSTVKRLLAKGELPFVYVGRRPRIPWIALHAVVAAAVRAKSGRSTSG